MAHLLSNRIGQEYTVRILTEGWVSTGLREVRAARAGCHRVPIPEPGLRALSSPVLCSCSRLLQSDNKIVYMFNI
jgi:hypothetical protein